MDEDQDRCSASKVLLTVELLEQILSSATARDILRLRRTCTFFQNVVASSSVLQRKIFFKADPAIKDAQWLLNDGLKMEEYPVDVKPLEPSINGLGTRYLYNELILKRQKATSTHRRRKIEPEKTVALPASVLQLKPLPFKLCNNASKDEMIGVSYFRDMFLTQPPIVKVLMAIHTRPRSIGFTERITVASNDSGLTYGDIVDIARAEARSYPGIEIVSVSILPANIGMATFATADEMAMMVNGKWYLPTTKTAKKVTIRRA